MTLFHGLGPISSSLASGDLQFITSVTGSATSAINVNNCFSASYDHYLILKNFSLATGGNYGTLRLRSGSTDDTGANYRRQYIVASSTSVTSARSTGATVWDYVFGYGESSSFGFGNLWISNPFGSVRTTAWSNGSFDASANIQAWSSVYEHDLTTSYDGFTFIPNATTVTGTLYVYGLKV